MYVLTGSSNQRTVCPDFYEQTARIKFEGERLEKMRNGSNADAINDMNTSQRLAPCSVTSYSKIICSSKNQYPQEILAT